jgi:hypothetical protein
MAKGKAVDQKIIEEISEIVEEMENAEQVVQITSWDQLVEELAPGGLCRVPLKSGKIIEFKVNGLTKPELEAIEKKYEKMVPKQPSRLQKNPQGNGTVRVLITEGPDYEDWKTKKDSVDERKMCEYVMKFLPEDLKPKVDESLTGDEKIIAQARLLGDKIAFGNFIKIVNAGFEASGVNTDENEKLQQAKNS